MMSDSNLLQKRMVIALGGNAISKPDEEGNVDQQFTNSRITAVALAELIDDGHQLIITHGNGPQIGNFLLRNRAAADAIYPLPMEVACAHVQGGMGYMIAQTLTNELTRRGVNRTVTSIVTTVLVDQHDPSFATPTKPIGMSLPKEEVDRFATQRGWTVTEVSPGMYRRLIASPKPLRIMEIDTIRKIVDDGELVVVCGGGGIPIIQNEQKELSGVRAVIDKDHASALLAAELDADSMMILTNVDRVSINFGEPDEKQIETMTVADAQRYMSEGQFPAGSMGPKVQGAIDFLLNTSKPDASVIIGPLHKAKDAIAGKTGTLITKN